MKKDKLKEYYGTQRPSFAGGPGAGSNFYSGRDLGFHSRGSLGTRGADSNFSRITMQRIVPEDLYEEEIEIDEDYEVENSRYSLEETLELIKEWTEGPDGVLDPEPGDIVPVNSENESSSTSLALISKSEDSAQELIGDIFLDTKQIADITSIAYTIGKSKSKSEIAANVAALFTRGGRVAGGAAARKIPVLADVMSIFDFFKSWYDIVSSASKIKEMDKDFKKMLKTTSMKEMVRKREHYIDLFIDGIKAVEKEQKIIYEDIGEMLENLIEVLSPLDYFAAILGTAGTPAGTVAAGVAAKTLEGATASVIGEVLEKAIKEMTQSFEIDADGDQFLTWLKQNRDPSSRGLRFLVWFLGIFNMIPGSGLFTLGFSGVFEGLLRGAKLQNTLMQKITMLKNPDIIPAEDLEDSESLTSSAADAVVKAFFSPTGSSSGIFSNVFNESLEKRSLIYLIEEKDPELSEEAEEDVNEISGAGAAAGFTLPLGASPESDSGQRSSHSGGTAFPYGKKTQRRRKEFARKTFGGK